MAYAREEDHEICRRIHRRFGATYYFATLRFPKKLRRRTHALYGFVRAPDEWVDNPRGESLDVIRRRLHDYREQLLGGLRGRVPEYAVLRPFVDLMHEIGLSEKEPLLFLDAMEQDLSINRYETYSDLAVYMRGSAAAVGVMMCQILGCGQEEVEGAIALGNAMQMTNFLRDVGEDARRGRIYLPQEDLRRFEVDPSEVLSGRMPGNFAELMRFEIDRTRALYAQSDASIAKLQPEARRAVLISRVLYSRILDRIERRNYDVFSGRARTTRVEKLSVAARALFSIPPG